MTEETIKFFNLKKKKHPVFGDGYVFTWKGSDWVKDATALEYKLLSIEGWARNMQEVLRKEEKL